MTERQRQAALYDLQQEKRIMRRLEQSYKNALKQVDERIRKLGERTDEKNKPSIAYQKQFQTAVKNQLEDILKALHAETYEIVDEYICESYTDGIVQTMYQLHEDGIPIVMPIPQDRVVKAVQNDTNLSKPLYDAIGEDMRTLKQHITDVISAGFAAGTSVNDMAHQITAKMIGDYSGMKGGALGKAKTIARTESNRVANAARLDAAMDAKKTGADTVKQWDSTMDRATRPHHVELDGQVRELGEPFEVAGHKAMAPHQFGIASEDVNCRCRVNIRPRWSVISDLENDRMKMDGETGNLVKIDSDEYREFKALYLKEAENLEKNPENVTKPSNDGEPSDSKVVEVDVKTPPTNGGKGKAYQPEKIPGKALTSGGDDGIIKEKEEIAENALHYIGKVDIEKYKCITNDILTDEVIVTSERIQHIKERHPNDYEKYCNYMKEIVENPDYIIESKKPNTALILKSFHDGDEQFKTVLRLVTSTDNPNYKNSIITFMKINEKEWNRMIKNKKVLYKSE